MPCDTTPYCQPAAESSMIMQLDERCTQLYHDLLRPYVDQLHTLPTLAFSNHESVFAHVLEVVRRCCKTGYEDFKRRLRTHAIPFDACNYYACLAGSIFMCGRDDLQEQNAHEVAEALVGFPAKEPPEVMHC